MIDPDIDGIPPQDLESEEALLGGILAEGASGLELCTAILDSDDFYEHRHATIFRTCVTLYRAKDPVNEEIVTAHLRSANLLEGVGGYAKFDRLASERCNPWSIQKLAQFVRDRSVRRKLLEAGRHIRMWADNSESADTAIVHSLEAINKVAHISHQGIDESTGTKLVQAVDRELSAFCKPIPTGISMLDRFLRGGVSRQQVHLLTARPGEGKSAAVAKFMYAAIENGNRPGVLSLEMPKSEVMGRLISLRSGLPCCDMFPRLAIPTQSDLNDYYAHREWFKERLTVEAPGRCTVDDMDRLLHRMVIRDKCDILFVDLLGRVRGKGHSEVERLDDVVNRLEEIIGPHDLPVPLWLVQQQNEKTNPYPNHPSIATCKGTGIAADNAAVVVGLWRKHVEIGEDCEGRMFVFKNRSLNVCPLGFPLVGNDVTFDWSCPDDKRSNMRVVTGNWEREDDDPFDEG